MKGEFGIEEVEQFGCPQVQAPGFVQIRIEPANLVSLVLQLTACTAQFSSDLLDLLPQLPHLPGQPFGPFPGPGRLLFLLRVTAPRCPVAPLCCWLFIHPVPTFTLSCTEPVPATPSAGSCLQSSMVSWCRSSWCCSRPGSTDPYVFQLLASCLVPVCTSRNALPVPGARRCRIRVRTLSQPGGPNAFSSSRA